MSIISTSGLSSPSAILAEPGDLGLPDFETLRDFDKESDTLIADYDTQAAIEARSGEPVGTLYYAYDADRLYVYDGSNWQYYTST